MKKTISVLLMLALIFSLSVTAFAASATADITLTYDLSSGGSNDIVVKTGEVITVSYKLSASESSTVSVAQNEIYYDHTFFELVKDSNRASSGFTDYTTSLQERLSGKRYVFFNTMTTHTHDTTPVEIGTFQLKVIAASGETTIANENAKASDVKNNHFGTELKDLHVSIGSAQEQKFTVTFKGENGATYKTETVKAGQPVTIPAGPAKANYTFSHWSIGGDSTRYTSGMTYTPTSDTVFTPNWTADSSGGGGSGSGSTYYTIKATAGTHGSISPSGSVSVREGRDQTFTITPDKGYAVAKVLIDGRDVGAVKSYTFENVKKAHTIEVTFAEDGSSPQGGTFVDVPDGSYYEEAVNWAVEKGITSGVSATIFNPNGVCTRAQAVTFLWRAAGSPAPESATMPFTDVTVGSYYYNAVLWAVENGITKGTTDTTFSPNMNCSRGQIVTFLWRSQKSPAAGSVNPFSDVKSDAYYADAVLWAVKESVTSGTTATTFSPNADCTRAQIVTFIYRALAE